MGKLSNFQKKLNFPIWPNFHTLNLSKFQPGLVVAGSWPGHGLLARLPSFAPRQRLEEVAPPCVRVRRAYEGFVVTARDGPTACVRRVGSGKPALLFQMRMHILHLPSWSVHPYSVTLSNFHSVSVSGPLQTMGCHIFSERYKPSCAIH